MLAVLTGCGSDDSSSGGGASVGASCSSSADCDTGSVCAEVTEIDGGAQVLSGGCPDLSVLPRRKRCQPEQGLVERPLGEVNDGDAVVLDFAEGAASFALVARSPKAEPIVFGRLEGPAGNDLYLASADVAQMLKNEVWFYPEPFVATLQVPTTPDHPLSRGPYCATLQAGGPVDLTAVLKRDRDGDVTAGRLDIDFYLVGLETAGCGMGGITAAGAPSHAVMAEALKSAGQIFSGAKIELGDLAFHDRASIPALAQLTTNDPATFDPVFELATESEGYSVDVFIVDTIADGAGFAGHMPGPPGLHGLPRSGVVVSAQTACSQTLGVVIAHEVSHLLGLFHNFQPDPGFEDPILDTDSGQQNLMHITPNTQSTEITAGQGFVLRRHANVRW